MTTPSLNPMQRAVAEHVAGPALVLAPAGSGKTMVLAERVVRAVRSGTDSARILCITFTNLAAKQLRERVHAVLPEHARWIWCGTFHRFCAHVLRRESAAIGLASDFVIVDEEDSREIIRRLKRCWPPGVADQNQEAELQNRLDNSRAGISAANLRLDGRFAEYLPANMQALASAYREALNEAHCLDFADLIMLVRAAFHRCHEIRERWSTAFDLVQVDEIQDTHLAEYDVLRVLGHLGNICLLGDIDQAIYGWRGARSDRVVRAFKEDFSPALFSLDLNYRATKVLQATANRMADRFAHRETRLIPDVSCPAGEPVSMHFTNTMEQEADYIAADIQTLLKRGAIRPREIAVLTRTNKRAESIAGALVSRNVPALAPEAFHFFRRKEIKDALAFLKLILNPNDAGAAMRLTREYIRGIGSGTLRTLVQEGDRCGLRLADMLRETTHRYEDPFGELPRRWDEGDLVIFDTETTGLAELDDEIVEIAAARIGPDGVRATFRELIRPSRSVGATIHIHGYTDELLAEQGRAAATVFKEFLDFCGPNALLCAHNASYDYAILQSHAARCGIDTTGLSWIDSYDLCRRFLRLPSLRLEDIAKALGLPQRPAHRALDDVMTTVDMLGVLREQLMEGAGERVALVRRHGECFADAARKFAYLRNAACTMRPAALFDAVDEAFGLRRHYEYDRVRVSHLDRMATILKEQDEPDRSPREALLALTRHLVCSKSIDHLSQRDDVVVCAPVHQVKGLEFRAVYLAEAVDQTFPHFLCTDIEEEKRLFYVAITRPRERLTITGYRHFITQHGFKYPRKPSPFLACVNR